MNNTRIAYSRCTTCIVVLLLLLTHLRADAHTLPYDFQNMSQGTIGWIYLSMGFNHIVPYGLDHILFVLGIFLLNPKLKSVIWQATAFTLAHSVTLSLAAYGHIQPQPHFIEPVIAMSIVFVGIENLLATELKWWRVVVIFLFGLIHGCGFAGVLAEIGLPEHDNILALASFNLGVELGQIAVILAAYAFIARLFADKSWYRNRISIPLSLCITAVALYWTVVRITG